MGMKSTNSLTLWVTDRPVGANQTPRRFLDFVMDGRSLYEQLGSPDFITPLGWISPASQEAIVNTLTLAIAPTLAENRQALYVCPECGDLACGSITAVIVRDGGHVVWRDFAWYRPPSTELDPVTNELRLGEGPSIRREEFLDVGPYCFDVVTYSAVLQGVRHTRVEQPAGLVPDACN